VAAASRPFTCNPLLPEGLGRGGRGGCGGRAPLDEGGISQRNSICGGGGPEPASGRHGGGLDEAPDGRADGSFDEGPLP